MSHTFYFQHPETREVASAKSREEILDHVGHLFLSRSDVAEKIGRSDLLIDEGICQMADGRYGEQAKKEAELHLEAERLVEAVNEYFDFYRTQGVMR